MLFVRMFWVINHDLKRISKDRYGFFKTDAMFLPIKLVLAFVPFNIVRRRIHILVNMVRCMSTLQSQLTP